MFFNHGLSPAYAKATAGRRTALINARPGRARALRAPHLLVSVCTFFALALTSFAADPAITVSAQQRYPWNGLVDLHFTITGDAGTKYDTSFTAKDMVGNTNIAMQTIRKSNGVAAKATEQLLPGNYKWVWDTVADLPKGFKSNRVRVTGTANISAFPYSVKFNANGGTGTMADESFTYGTAKALTANAFTRTGYTFQGWATSSSGAKVYNDKQSVSNLTQTSGAVVNLYAVWDHEKVQLWANGPYWATINVGASKTTDSGYFFWWGDTIGYKRQNNKWVASDGSSSNFSFNPNTAPTYGKTFAKLYSGGWTTTSSESSAKLVTKHDAARAHWGGSWRMPTKSDFAGLSEKCTYESTTINGVKGYIYKGKGSYANKSIFLPGAGHANNTGYGDNFDSVAGLTIPDVQYWSSNPDIGGNYSDYGTEGAISHFGFSYRNYRYYGRPIRPVCSQ